MPKVDCAISNEQHTVQDHPLGSCGSPFLPSSTVDARSKKTENMPETVCEVGTLIAYEEVHKKSLFPKEQSPIDVQ